VSLWPYDEATTRRLNKINPRFITCLLILVKIEVVVLRATDPSWELQVGFVNTVGGAYVFKGRVCVIVLAVAVMIKCDWLARVISAITVCVRISVVIRYRNTPYVDIGT